MTYRNRALLDLAHSMPCLAQFPHNCTGWQGCEPSHSDWLMFGRGAGHKSPDWAWASMCNVAHGLNATMERETKRMEWLRAYIETQDWLWEHGLIQVAA